MPICRLAEATIDTGYGYSGPEHQTGLDAILNFALSTTVTIQARTGLSARILGSKRTVQPVNKTRILDLSLEDEERAESDTLDPATTNRQRTYADAIAAHLGSNCLTCSQVDFCKSRETLALSVNHPEDFVF